MWYIIKTDFYKERDAIRDLLLLDGIQDIYFPSPRLEGGEIRLTESPRHSAPSSAVSSSLMSPTRRY